MRRPGSPNGFTLLETVVAMAILSVALMGIFDLNAGAIRTHSYTKRLTVATLLARSKMTDIEQKLYDKPFPTDDEEDSGDFSEEGWASFKWRAKIIVPKTEGVSPDQVIGAIFGLPIGGDPTKGDSGGLGALLGGLTGGKGAASPGGGPTPGGGPGGGGGLMGMLGPLVSTQFTQMVDQITKTVREVHLTVSWRDGKQIETIDLVTHVVSMGPGGDRNGVVGANPSANGGNPNEPMVNARTGAPVPNPVPGAGGQMVDPATNDPAIPLSQFQAQSGAGRPPPGAQPPGQRGFVPSGLGKFPGLQGFQ